MIVDQIEPILGEVVIISYDGDFHPDNRTFHGQASAVLDNECKYEGSFANGMFHGKGVFQWPSGVKFEGDFVKGQIIGKGTYEWSDGSTYQGDVLDGLRHGVGKFAGSSGQVYEGDWAFGKRHGKGKIWYNEERTSSYNGDWKMNLRDGYGTMKYTSGNSYEGEWKDDKKCGCGLMVWRDVDEIYSGEWRADLPHGLGEHIWGDSSSHSVKKEVCNIYRGGFVEGRREGQGAFFYMNGSQYVGEWQRDAKHGEGLFLYADGRIFGGQFRHNRMMTEHSKEETGAPRATEAVNPQFRLNIGDVFAAYPSLLQSAGAVLPAARAATVGTAVNISTLSFSKDGVSPSERREREVKEMERLLLKYNHYLRGALRRYTDFANKRRLRDALQQHQLLSAWSPSDVPSRAHKACATARIFQKRLFCMNLDQMLRFLRECGIVGPFFRSFDLSQCFLQMREEARVACVGKLREYGAAMRSAAAATEASAEGKGEGADPSEGTADGSGVEDLGESEEEFERYLSLRLDTVMDAYLHPGAADPAFTTLACQPLFEREFVELFVRAVAARYARARALSASYSQETAAVAGMSLTQILYYVLAQKLLPLVTDFDEHTPAFFREFCHEEVQTLLLSNEATSAHAAQAEGAAPGGGVGAGNERSPTAAARSPTASAPARSPSHRDSAAAGGGENSSVEGAAGKDGFSPDGTSVPTCFEKMWAHLRSLDPQNFAPKDGVPSVCGTALGAMHMAGPPALKENRTGGSVKLGVLLDYMLSLRGSAVATDTTLLQLMVALECAVPSAIATAQPAAAKQPSPMPQPPVGEQEAAEPTPDASADAPLPPQLQDYDLSCVEMRVDFLDFLELFCRLVLSALWVFQGASPASLLPAQHPPQQLHEGDADSASVYSVSLSEVLAERIAVWKQNFDFDSLGTTAA